MKKFLKYLISILVGLAIAFTMMGIWGVFSNKLDTTETMKKVCDAFFMSSALLMGLGALLWVSKEGVFNGLSYSVKNLLHIHKISSKEWQRNETFAEYKERISEKVKKRELLFLVIVGSGYLLLAILFLILYHTL